MAVEVLNGRNVLLFFRERANHQTEDADKLRFQTLSQKKKKRIRPSLKMDLSALSMMGKVRQTSHR